MTGLKQANLRKQLAKIHVEENEQEIELANKVIMVSVIGSFTSVFVSFFFPWAVFIFAGFLAMTSYTLFLRTNIQEDLDSARQRYKRACERLEELEKEFLLGEDYP